MALLSTQNNVKIDEWKIVQKLNSKIVLILTYISESTVLECNLVWRSGQSRIVSAIMAKGNMA